MNCDQVSPQTGTHCLGVVDDEGRYLHANDILVLLYYYLLKYKKWHAAQCEILQRPTC